MSIVSKSIKFVAPTSKNAIRDFVRTLTSSKLPNDNELMPKMTKNSLNRNSEELDRNKTNCAADTQKIPVYTDAQQDVQRSKDSKQKNNLHMIYSDDQEGTNKVDPAAAKPQSSAQKLEEVNKEKKEIFH